MQNNECIWKKFASHHVRDMWYTKRNYYSETTWAVGIAQLTQHEVQGGGKNPETEGRGIFAPTADGVVS